MKKIQPKLVKGTRDFLPEQVAKRKYILNTIQNVFRKFGFQEIETPAIESLATLTGKYGAEGDKLLFKILNSGDYLSKANDAALSEKNSRALTASISEKGLRYDLTVPLARYVVQHQNDLQFPFKRYHIGPVWRADRPQKGRYREFYQCDADVIGSTAILNEIELTSILGEVFAKLNCNIEIQINNRKILEGIIAVVGASDLYTEILVTIDKLDKIGLEKVTEELGKLDLTVAQVEQLLNLFQQPDLASLAAALDGNSDLATTGIEELQAILDKCSHYPVCFNTALARGLDYYTGTIWEVKANDVSIGTISAGGRYDNLTKMFGGQNMSGVGISFGIERIYDVLEELNLWPDTITTSTRVLIINFGNESETKGWELLQALRAQDIPAELYPSSAKLKKQMTYANKKHIPFVVFIGDEELAANKFSIKNMESGEQELLTLEQIVEFIGSPQ